VNSSQTGSFGCSQDLSGRGCLVPTGSFSVSSFSRPSPPTLPLVICCRTWCTMSPCINFLWFLLHDTSTSSFPWVLILRLIVLSELAVCPLLHPCPCLEIPHLVLYLPGQVRRILWGSPPPLSLPLSSFGTQGDWSLMAGTRLQASFPLLVSCIRVGVTGFAQIVVMFFWALVSSWGWFHWTSSVSLWSLPLLILGQICQHGSPSDCPRGSVVTSLWVLVDPL